MKQIIKLIIIIGILSNYSCDKCGEIVPEKCGDYQSNSKMCGWSVVTCNAALKNDPIGVIYDTQNNVFAPLGDDWGKTIQSVHPIGWTLGNLGQIFGITIDKHENIYLASSDIYFYDGGTGITTSSNLNRPFPCGQIFKCSPPNWNPIPFTALPNTCGTGNGIGNIAYDKWNDQFFASNLEDGKIYRIDRNGNQLESYDPIAIDNGKPGIADTSELVWGLNLNKEGEEIKLYYTITNSVIRNLYSISLNIDKFPSAAGSEKLEVSNLPGTQNKFTDISFSSNNKSIILAERGDPHRSKVIKLQLVNTNWLVSSSLFYIGGFTGENSAGGVDFYSINDSNNKTNKCDENFWVSANYMMAKNVGFSRNTTIYGVTGVSANGNELVDINSTTSSAYTDIFIDLDGVYGPSVKGGIGDVEVFDCAECSAPCKLNDFIK